MARVKPGWMTQNKSVAIVGTGPAGLMTADVVSGAGHSVSIFEKRKGAARKLLIAGSSGLNVTNSLPPAEFARHYSGPPDFWARILGDFSPQDWIHFIESLGIGTFKGTSGRYFVEDMKAPKFLQAWTQRLRARGVEFHFDRECVNFAHDESSGKWRLQFADSSTTEFDAVCFCLGGGSYEPSENPLRWPAMFITKGVGFTEFTSSNAGFQIAWTEAFLKEAEGLPLKNITLTTRKGRRQGDAVITKYGMEGTPVYAVGVSGAATLDLKPDLSVEQILVKCRTVKENLSPIRRVKKQLKLSPAALALLFHFTPEPVLKDLERLARHIKEFPLELLGARPLAEAISSAGGLHLSELDEKLMLGKFPGIFAAGEMLDWDAPTGGFLIQACVSQGSSAGKGILRFLNACA